jgi:hypothetical protein
MPRPINRASDMNIMKPIERFDTDDKYRLTLRSYAGRPAFAASVVTLTRSSAPTSVSNSSAALAAITSLSLLERSCMIPTYRSESGLSQPTSFANLKKASPLEYKNLIAQDGEAA